MTTIDQTVFVIEDDPAVRQSLLDLMTSAGLAAEGFACGRDFLAAHGGGDGGCVVLDVCLPDMNGIQILKELKQRGAQVSVVMISGASDIPNAVEALHRGAFDFMEKPFAPQQLLARVREALLVTNRRRLALAQQAELEARFARLTRREREVVDFAVNGLNNRQIAARFAVSSQAVDAHRKRAMQKLGVTTVAELVQLVLTARGSGTGLGPAQAPAPAPLAAPAFAG
ncbi:MAG TPA: response regulator [Phycisphaerae bacterium]|nr:response regulator [Phycisphaerae bacterium]